MSNPSGSHIYVYIAGLTAALAGLLFGFDIGVISGALPFIKTTFVLNTSQEEWVVSSILMGAVIGAISSGFLARRYGRRFILLVSAFFFCVGSVLSAVSSSVEMLISVRLFLGLALGAASFTAPLYLSEIAPRTIRGGLISLYQLMITLGILIAYLSDLYFSDTGNWRWMLGVLFFPSVLMLVAVCFLPKSPRWLMLNGHEAEARSVLQRLRQGEEVESELCEIRETLTQHNSLKAVLSQPVFLKVILLGVALQAIQQFSGMNTILYYAPEIFRLAGFATVSEQMWATVTVGLVNVLTTFIAIAYVDRIGRRPLLLAGVCVTTLSMFCLGALFYMGLEGNSLGDWAKYAASAIVLCFIFGFAISLGPVVWILCSEIYPLQGRDIGVTCSTTSNWLCNATVGFTFLSLLNSLGPANTFWLYAVVGLFSVLFVVLFCPETKEVSLETIEANLFSRQRLRDIGINVHYSELSEQTSTAQVTR